MEIQVPQLLSHVVKAGIDNQVSKKQRQEISLLIRKHKREDHLRKRRCSNIKVFPEAQTLPNVSYHSEAIDSSFQIVSGDPVTSAVTAFVSAFRGAGGTNMLPAIQAVRRLISNENMQHFTTDEVLKALKQALCTDALPKLQHEAAWILTNIASAANYTNLVVKAGVLPLVSPLLVADDEQLREQAAWLLGNVAGESTTFRDLVLDLDGVVEGVMFNLLHPSSKSVTRIFSWFVSNLCRGSNPKPDFYVVSSFIPVLGEQVVAFSDEETALHSCWALAFLSDSCDEFELDRILETGVAVKMVQLILSQSSTAPVSSTSSGFVVPCLRVLGNIATGTDHQTQLVIDQGLMRCLLSILTNGDLALRKEVTWVLSNIAAGSESQVQHLLHDESILQYLVGNAQNAEWSVRKEAAWALCNICNGGSVAQVQFIVEKYDVLLCFSELLDKPDPSLVLATLVAIDSVLKIDQRYGSRLEECDGFDRIETLVAEHQCEEISEKAREIAEDYFADTDTENAIDDDDDFAIDDGPGPDYFREFNFSPPRTFCFLNDSEMVGVNDFGFG